MTSSTRSTRRSLVAILLAAVVIQAGLAIAFGWVGDDAFIAFRYARNLAEGQGLRFNPGVEPPVEGDTQLGWILVAALVERVGLPVVAATRAVEIAVGLVLLVLVARRAQRRGGTPAALAAALFLATSPGIVVWSSGGLGTILFATTIFLVVDFAVAERPSSSGARSRLLGATCAAIAVTVVRFDGAYFAGWALLAVLVAGLLTRSRELRRIAVVAGVVTLLAIAAQSAWRLSYHGDWLPYTARAKVAFSPWVAERGLRYVLVNWLNVPATAIATLLLVLPSLRSSSRSEDAWRTVASIVVVASLTYCIAVGGDFMAMGRFLLPTLPFLAIAAGDAVAALVHRGRTGTATFGVAALLCGSLPVLFGAVYTPESLRRALDFRYGHPYETELEFLRGDADRATFWSEIGRALALHTDPSESLVRGPIGAVGYYSRLTIFDQFGLVDREVALHDPRGTERKALPGHDLFADPTFFAERNPTYLLADLYFGIVETSPEDQAMLKNPYFATGKVELFQVRKADGFYDDGTLVLVRC
ncbi:MAG: hypothetical protein R3F34_01560 [Planctomycetota bacterium]